MNLITKHFPLTKSTTKGPVINTSLATTEVKVSPVLLRFVGIIYPLEY